MTLAARLDVLPGAQRSLWPSLAQLPPMDAVKALGYFAEGDAVNVDASVRDILICHTTGWDRTVSAMSKANATTLGPG